MSKSNKSSLLDGVRVIVFDFDGVITRTGEYAKEEAWEELPNRIPKRDEINRELFKEILFSERHSGGTRYDILRRVYITLGIDPECFLKSHSRIFGEIVIEKIIAGNLSVGASDALHRLSKFFPLYINSATPEKALLDTVHVLGISSFFKGIYGFSNLPQSMISKVDIMNKISKEQINVDFSEVLFIGDADSDFEVAKQLGCKFVGFGNTYNNWNPDSCSFPVIFSLQELQ